MAIDAGKSPSAQVEAQPSEGFVMTPALADISERAITYLRAGYPVHFCGPTGTGKTTLAFHAAAQLGRPIVMLHGDHLFTSADLVGTTAGTRTSRMIDNYVRSVVKMEEESRELWVDNRLTTACRMGHTLLYDEFNRTSPEANNPLLSVFSERILNLPRAHDGRESYIHVHRRFAAILTSNPEEYAGVHKTPDALADRLITINLGDFDSETEQRIVSARSNVSDEMAAAVTEVVRLIRAEGGGRQKPTVRAAITISKILATTGCSPDPEDPFFRGVLKDVLGVDPQIVNKALFRSLRTSAAVANAADLLEDAASTRQSPVSENTLTGTTTEAAATPPTRAHDEPPERDSAVENSVSKAGQRKRRRPRAGQSDDPFSDGSSFDGPFGEFASDARPASLPAVEQQVWTRAVRAAEAKS